MDMIVLAILIIFLLLTLIGIAISTFNTGISPTPSSYKNRKTLVSAIDQCLKRHTSNSQIHLIDAGSGFGGMCFYIQKETGLNTLGIEYGWYPWCVSQLRRFFSKEKQHVQFIKANFKDYSFDADTIVIAYLYVSGIEELYHQLRLQQQKPIALVSLAFSVKAIKADAVLYTQDMFKTPVYIYYFKSLFA